MNDILRTNPKKIQKHAALLLMGLSTPLYLTIIYKKIFTLGKNAIRSILVQL
jgi:hypothetical protein